MNEHIADARVVSGIHERDQVLLVAVHAAIGDKSQQVEPRPFCLRKSFV